MTRAATATTSELFAPMLAEIAQAPARCMARIAYRAAGSRYTWTPLEAAPAADGRGMTAENPHLRVRWWIQAHGHGQQATLHGEIEALGHPIELEHVVVARFDLGDLSARTQVFINGYHSWTPARALHGEAVQRYPRTRSFALMNHYVDSPYWGRNDGLISSLFAAIARRPGDHGTALVLGFVTQNAGLGEIFVQTRGPRGAEACLDYGGKRLLPGTRLELEPLEVRRDLPLPALEGYAEAAGRAMHARSIDRDASPVGWCSWYELYTSVREEDVLANLEVLRKHPHLGISVVQLDDGYQTAVGDWLSLNAKFPRGLEALTGKIREAGFAAGLWSAPFFASRSSKLVAEHPAWQLHDEREKPVECGFNPSWRTRLVALDLTHPEVLAWLGEVFGTWCREGFDYFKIDFLFAGLRHGKRHDPDKSPVEAYRMGMAAIRQAIGDQRFLLGCGAPIGPSMGFVDGMRISCDVKEVWHSRAWAFVGRGCGIPSARDSLQNNITRAFLHRRFWLNDPDCLLVREQRSELTQDEVRLLVTVLAMTGGLLFLSDDLSRLDSERLAWASAALPPSRLTAHAPTVLDEAFPTRFVMNDAAAGPLSRTLDAHINWGDTPATRRLAAAVPVPTRFDVWAEEILSASEVTIPAHGVRALIETPPQGVPQVVGTNLHLTALVDGRIRDQYQVSKNQLLITGSQMARQRGELWILVPPGYQLAADPLPELVRAKRTWQRGDTHGLVLTIEAPAAEWSLELGFSATP